MNILNLSVFFFAFGTFLIGLLVYFKRQDEVGRKWLLFSFTASVWGFFYAMWANDLFDQATSLMWMRMSHAGSIFIPAAFLDFTYSFLGKSTQEKSLPSSIVKVSSFVLSPLILTSYFLEGARPFGYFFSYYPKIGNLYHLFTILFFVTVIFAFIKTLQAHRSSCGERRLQLKYLIWATGIGFVGGSLTFLPAYQIDFPQYNVLAMPLYPFIMAYALTRHHLLDLQQIAELAQRDKLASIGILAASINHEIRNPLYVIKGSAESYLENLRQGIYPTQKEALERSSEILSKAIIQTERAMDIMRRLSLFAKQGSRQETHLEKVNLFEALEGILPLVRHELELDKIKLVMKIPEDLPPLFADRRHIEEILFNLIVNACQAMRDGGELLVSAEQRNGTVQIRIEDQGPGIPSEDLSRIFEPFYTTKETGTGLGLYVTKQLVERNRGHIRVRSELGKGSCFTVGFSTERGI